LDANVGAFLVGASGAGEIQLKSKREARSLRENKIFLRIRAISYTHA